MAVPPTLVSADDTVVAGVNGSQSYHLLLGRNSGVPATFFTPAVAGTDAATVAAAIGLSTGDLLVQQVFQSAGRGQSYTYNAAAVAEAGAVVKDGLSTPKLDFVSGVYRTNYTVYVFEGTTYANPSPEDALSVFFGAFGEPEPLLSLLAQVQAFRRDGIAVVRSGGVAVARRPTEQELTAGLILALAGWLAQWPSAFSVEHEVQDLDRIAKQLQLDTYQLGQPYPGSISEPEFRQTVFNDLKRGAEVIRDSFGDLVGAENLLFSVEQLRTGSLSRVRTANAVRDAAQPINALAFRKAAFDLLESLILEFSYLLGGTS